MFHRRSPALVLSLCLVALLAIVAGCGGDSDDAEVVLATVGDRVIDGEYYTTRLAKLDEGQLPRDEEGQPYDMATMEGKRAFLDVIIDKELMVAKALEMGYDDDAQIDGALQSMLRFQAVRFFWEDQIADPTKLVTEEEVQEYYQRLGERRECSFIITDFESEAIACREEFQQGRPWPELVDEYHDGAMIGDKNPHIAIEWGQYRDDFEAPVFEVAEGEVAEPIFTEHGWWVVRVDSIAQERKPDLEAIHDQVLVSIAQRKGNLRREQIIKQQFERANLHIDEDALQIVYDGLPEDEPLIDPETNKPTPREKLEPLDVPTESYDKIIVSYDLSTGPVELTIADIKAQFDRQNVFDRPKRSQMIGGLRAKLRASSGNAIMQDHLMAEGYLEDDRVVRAANRKVEEMLVDKLHRENVSYQEYVSPDDVEGFWAEHADEFQRPERRTGQMLRTEDRETAEETRDALIAGDITWKTANARHGNDPELTASGARLGAVTADEQTPLSEVLFSLEKDDVSQPFEVDGGWAVVKLTRVLPAEEPSLEESREAVGARIRAQRMDASLRTMLEDWREQFPVTVHEDALAEMPSWQEAKQEMIDRQFELGGKG